VQDLCKIRCKIFCKIPSRLPPQTPLRPGYHVVQGRRGYRREYLYGRGIQWLELKLRLTMKHQMICPNLIYSCIITFKISGGCGAYATRW
jgi:hypothetical protein